MTPSQSGELAERVREACAKVAADAWNDIWTTCNQHYQARRTADAIMRLDLSPFAVPQDDPERRFYDGVLAALAVVADHDQPTIANDIINTVDRARLFTMADEHDLMVLKKLGVKK